MICTVVVLQLCTAAAESVDRRKLGLEILYFSASVEGTGEIELPCKLPLTGTYMFEKLLISLQYWVHQILKIEYSCCLAVVGC